MTRAVASKVNILAISGSLRRHSYNTALLHSLQSLAPAGVVVDVHSESGLIPHYDEDVRLTGDPEPVLDLKRRIAAADALVVATPEYNAGLPGALKDLIDWASRPRESSVLRGKPAAVIASSPGSQGGQRVDAHLRAVLTAAGTATLAEPRVTVSRVDASLDPEGGIVDPGLRDQLAGLLAALVEAVERTAADPG